MFIIYRNFIRKKISDSNAPVWWKCFAKGIFEQQELSENDISQMHLQRFTFESILKNELKRNCFICCTSMGRSGDHKSKKNSRFFLSYYHHYDMFHTLQEENSVRE